MRVVWFCGWLFRLILIGGFSCLLCTGRCLVCLVCCLLVIAVWWCSCFRVREVWCGGCRWFLFGLVKCGGYCLVGVFRLLLVLNSWLVVIPDSMC